MQSDKSVFQIIRKRWLLVAAVTAVCVAAAAAVSFTASRVYTSTEQLFVGFRDSSVSDLSAIESGGQFAISAVQSYVDIANSPIVTEPVIRSLDLHTTPTRLASHITADAPANTVLINLAVTDSSRFRAQQIAEAVGQQFATVVTTLQSSSDAGSSPVRVSVSSPATLPTSPTSPKPLRDLILALVVGVFLGAGVAVGLARLDNRIHSVGDLADALAIPLIGEIPDDPTLGGEILHSIEPGRRSSEPLRQLRTNLQFINPDDPPRVLMLTSALSGEGKSTLVCGLAMAIASAGLRVVVVEADLRRPSLAMRFGLPAGRGLATVLVDRDADPNASLQAVGDHDTFDVLPAKGHTPNPSELLGSKRMEQIIDSLRSRYDMVLIDSPPLLPVTDAAVLARLVDGVVLVVRAGDTKRPSVLEAIDVLAKVGQPVLGIVANRAKHVAAAAYGYEYASAPGKRDAVVLSPPAAPQGDPSSAEIRA